MPSIQQSNALLRGNIAEHLPQFMNDVNSGVDDLSIQRKYGEAIKALALRHLSEGESDLLTSLRQELPKCILEDGASVSPSSIDDFVSQQAKSGAAGHYVTLCALCDLFGITPQVISLKANAGGGKAYHYSLSNGEANKNIADQPIMTIYHHEGQDASGKQVMHWSISDNPYATDAQSNNCLYHAFAQYLKSQCHNTVKQLQDPEIVAAAAQCASRFRQPVGTSVAHSDLMMSEFAFSFFKSAEIVKKHAGDVSKIKQELRKLNDGFEDEGCADDRVIAIASKIENSADGEVPTR